MSNLDIVGIVREPTNVLHIPLLWRFFVSPHAVSTNILIPTLISTISFATICYHAPQFNYSKLKQHPLKLH